MCMQGKLRDPRKCHSCYLGTPELVGEGQEKMVHSARVSEYYSPILLPCQDGTDYTYVFPETFVFM